MRGGRRSQARSEVHTVATTDDSIEARLIERVLGEYREMPGLALTIDQAWRL